MGTLLVQFAQTDTHINDTKAIYRAIYFSWCFSKQQFMIWLVGKGTHTAEIPSSNLKITRQVCLSRKTMMKTSLLSIQVY